MFDLDDEDEFASFNKEQNKQPENAQAEEPTPAQPAVGESPFTPFDVTKAYPKTKETLPVPPQPSTPASPFELSPVEQHPVQPVSPEYIAPQAPTHPASPEYPAAGYPDEGRTPPINPHNEAYTPVEAIQPLPPQQEYSAPQRAITPDSQYHSSQMSRSEFSNQQENEPSGDEQVRQKKKNGKKSSILTSYKGNRGKVLILRTVIFTAIGALLLAGINAIIFPPTIPTPSQVSEVAKTAANITGFPSQSGERFVLDFATAYLTYSPTESATTRRARLQNYMTDDLLRLVDLRLPANTTLNLPELFPEGESSYSPKLITSYGPYVVASENKTESYAVYTVKFMINTSTFYMLVPVKYDAETLSITIGGSLSFRTDFEKPGTLSTEEYRFNPSSVDAALASTLNSDIQAFLQAWAVSDSTLINRYITAEATLEAKTGLEGTVRFEALKKLTIEAADEDVPSTATRREAEIEVEWRDPATNLVFSQVYIVRLVLEDTGRWAVYDILNFLNR